ncbi:MAG: carbonic anhydrase [Patescibacteria group bacterium]
MTHTCKALLVTCMDFRFQQAVFEFAKAQGLSGQYDLYSIAGAQKTFLAEATQATALKQVELSRKLHGMTNVYLIAHWDCGAYGGSQTFETPDKQRQTYLDDLDKAKNMILKHFREIQVRKYLANIDEDENIRFEAIK